MDIKTLTRRTLLDFCARAARGHGAADTAITLMKSRRRIAFPWPGLRRIRRLQQGFATDEMGFRVRLHGSNRKARTSALCQKRTFRHILTKQPEASIFAVRLAEWNSAE
jgi:hypothetical protein